MQIIERSVKTFTWDSWGHGLFQPFYDDPQYYKDPPPKARQVTYLNIVDDSDEDVYYDVDPPPKVYQVTYCNSSYDLRLNSFFSPYRVFQTLLKSLLRWLNR